MGTHDKSRDRTPTPGTTTPTGETGTFGQTDKDWQSDRSKDRDQGTTGMEQGDQTRPAQPDGTRPLERDQGTQNQKR